MAFAASIHQWFHACAAELQVSAAEAQSAQEQAIQVHSVRALVLYAYQPTMQ